MRCDRRTLLIAALAIAIAAAGCSHGICSRSSDCATGLECTTLGRCEVPVEIDAGTGSGGSGATTIDDAATGRDATDAGPELPPDDGEL